MLLSIEKILEKFDNRYLAVIIVSLEARRIKDEQTKGLVGPNINPVAEALKKLMAGKIKVKE